MTGEEFLRTLFRRLMPLDEVRPDQFRYVEGHYIYFREKHECEAQIVPTISEPSRCNMASEQINGGALKRVNLFCAGAWNDLRKTLTSYDAGL